MIIQQILKTNEPNRNGHVYTNESMREAVKTFKVGKMYGTIGQYTPFDPIYSLNLIDISHQVIELTEEKDGVKVVTNYKLLAIDFIYPEED